MTEEVPKSPVERVLSKYPAECRPALDFDALSNIGNGTHLVLFPIALVVLETILGAAVWHQSVLAAFYFGSCLFGLTVTRLGSAIPMRLLVIIPNAAIGVLLFATLLPGIGATEFTVLIGASFLLKVFQQVAEMNMFRQLYPDSHRSTVVGFLRAIAAVSALIVTFTSWWWFAIAPQWYSILFCLMGGMLIWAARSYAKIPVPARTMFHRDDRSSLFAAFATGCRVFFSDRRFVLYQIGFSMAGIANHIGLFLVPRVMRAEAGASDSTVRFVVAVMPILLLILTASVWGRFLDRRTPMAARGVFNVLQVAAFALYAYGGLCAQVWPLCLGGAVHALSNGGGAINWLTGSMYFAKPEHISLYNGIHVFLTGVRGFIGPPLALFLFVKTETIGSFTFEGLGLGPRVFVVSAVLSLIGALMMFGQAAMETRPRPENVLSE